jgi:hypothetical protein
VSQKVPPGEWIRVRIPGEPFPVHMRVANEPERPAFIDHEPDGSGGYRAVAARRAPQLAAGVYPVVVRLPDGATIETAIEIV